VFTRNPWWLDADHTAMFSDAQVPSETHTPALPTPVPGKLGTGTNTGARPGCLGCRMTPCAARKRWGARRAAARVAETTGEGELGALQQHADGRLVPPQNREQGFFSPFLLKKNKKCEKNKRKDRSHC